MQDADSRPANQANAEHGRQQTARALPAVDRLLREQAADALVLRFGRDATVAEIRSVLDSRRRALLNEKTGPAESLEPAAILDEAMARLEGAAQPVLRRVINATGIILHTGLGRARMPDCAAPALARAAGYCNVQMDLDRNARLDREFVIRDLVRELTGAGDCALVNNNAAATFIVLKAIAEGREVIVSRGELVEIGGSFRLPDIMRDSGAILREVGATNKTHLRDYEQAINPQTALILKVNKSNYRISGFARDVSIRELVELGRRHRVPVADDLGSGALCDLRAFGLPHEPTVRDSLAAGADLSFFSTDKLIGGPQGGLIAGSPELVQKVLKHPLYRILRVDKLTLAALEESLRLFRAPDRLAAQHPTFFMLSRTALELERQARALAKAIRDARPAWYVNVEADTAFPGGGTLPGLELPTFAVTLQAPDIGANELARLLRLSNPPVVPRIRDQRVVLDMRTVMPDEITSIAASVGRGKSNQ